ncbi:MAG: molybdopterin molybdotransferase MoeA [SAR202 cluster bacterium]|nr:molybdopterin molybdotransferase MoeA [SAR202 cluster bacterium]
METRTGHGHGRGHGHRHEDMLSVEEAYERIISAFKPLEAEERPILDALGQVLTEDVYSPIDIPPAANSAMDGYAVRANDASGASVERPVTLRVIGLVAAGQVPSKAVEKGTAIRIMTGAPVPPGADAVVPFEETDEVERRSKGAGLDEIAIRGDGSKGRNVRPAGEDVRRGARILERGMALRPSEIGVLASLGMGKVKVIRKPCVAIIATGDELQTPGVPLGPGKIYDANSYSLASSVAKYGGVAKVLGIARDNLSDMNRKLEEGLESDLLLTSAGVSKGDYDIVKDVLAERGRINFWSVRMRPAKPLAWGSLRGPGGREVPHLGLPGNPVSAMVAFEMFARPAILKMQGKKRLAKPMIRAILQGQSTITMGGAYLLECR